MYMHIHDTHMLHHCDPGGVALWVGDVGVDGADGEGPEQLPVQG